MQAAKPPEPPEDAVSGTRPLDGSGILSSRGETGLRRFDPKLADGFIFKSISAETRRAYRKTIRDFFAFVKGMHPSEVTPRQASAYRDHLLGQRKSANTIALRLSALRSFFAYLVADGLLERNPASVKLVSTPPSRPTRRGVRSRPPRCATC